MRHAARILFISLLVLSSATHCKRRRQPQEGASQVASIDGEVGGGVFRVFDLLDRSDLKHTEKITAVAVARPVDTSQPAAVATASLDGSVIVWDGTADESRPPSGRRLDNPNLQRVESLAITPSGEIVAASNKDQGVVVWRGAAPALFRGVAANALEFIDGTTLLVADAQSARITGYDMNRVEHATHTDAGFGAAVGTWNLSDETGAFRQMQVVTVSGRTFIFAAINNRIYVGSLESGNSPRVVRNIDTFGYLAMGLREASALQGVEQFRPIFVPAGTQIRDSEFSDRSITAFRLGPLGSGGERILVVGDVAGFVTAARVRFTYARAGARETVSMSLVPLTGQLPAFATTHIRKAEKVSFGANRCEERQPGSASRREYELHGEAAVTSVDVHPGFAGVLNTSPAHNHLKTLVLASGAGAVRLFDFTGALIGPSTPQALETDAAARDRIATLLPDQVFELGRSAGAAESARFGARMPDVIVGDGAGHVYRWNVLGLHTGKVVGTVTGAVTSVEAGTGSALGMAVAGSIGGSVELWDLRSSSLIWSRPSHPGGTMAVMFSANGEQVLSAGKDRRIVVRNRSDGAEIETYTAPAELLSMTFPRRFGPTTLRRALTRVRGVTADTSEQRIVAGGSDGRLYVFTRRDGRASAPGPAVPPVRISPRINLTDPAEPLEPVEPTEPTEPTEPVEPVLEPQVGGGSPPLTPTAAQPMRSITVVTGAGAGLVRIAAHPDVDPDPGAEPGAPPMPQRPTTRPRLCAGCIFTLSAAGQASVVDIDSCTGPARTDCFAHDYYYQAGVPPRPALVALNPRATHPDGFAPGGLAIAPDAMQLYIAQAESTNPGIRVDGEPIVSGFPNTRNVWDLVGHTAPITGIKTVRDDGARVVSVAEDNSLRVWNQQKCNEDLRFSTHVLRYRNQPQTRRLTALTLVPFGPTGTEKMALTGDSQGNLRLWWLDNSYGIRSTSGQ